MLWNISTFTDTAEFANKEVRKKSQGKSMVYFKNFPRCARQFVKNVLKEDFKLFMIKIYKKFSRCAGHLGKKSY